MLAHGEGDVCLAVCVCVYVFGGWATPAETPVGTYKLTGSKVIYSNSLKNTSANFYRCYVFTKGQKCVK